MIVSINILVINYVIAINPVVLMYPINMKFINANKKIVIINVISILIIIIKIKNV